MDIINSVLNGIISMFFTMLPYTWQFVVGFLVGCWFYRYMLRKSPQRLQQLVDLANNSGALASKVGSVASATLDSLSPTKK